MEALCPLYMFQTINCECARGFDCLLLAKQVIVLFPICPKIPRSIKLRQEQLPNKAQSVVRVLDCVPNGPRVRKDFIVISSLEQKCKSRPFPAAQALPCTFCRQRNEFRQILHQQHAPKRRSCPSHEGRHRKRSRHRWQRSGYNRQTFPGEP